MKRPEISPCERLTVLSVERHAKGGVIVAFERSVGPDKERHFEALHPDPYNWYWWPECEPVQYGSALTKAYDAWEIRNRYNPPVEIAPPLPRGNPRICMFCREDMSGLAAHCLACGGAMHLACSRESGDKCLTPGCAK